MEEKSGFILYFDLLGYKQIVKHQSFEEKRSLAKLLDSVLPALSKRMFALELGDDFAACKDRIFVRGFSDNFLCLFEAEATDKKAFESLASISTMVQAEFLKQGYLIRGSISYGEIWVSERIVFGEALSNAVELEESHPEPSILIHPDLVKGFGLSLATTGMFYCWPDSGLDYEDALQGLKKAARRIGQQGYDPKLVSKLQWAIDRANLYFQRDQKKRFFLKESHRLSLDIEETSTHE